MKAGMYVIFVEMRRHKGSMRRQWLFRRFLGEDTKLIQESLFYTAYICVGIVSIESVLSTYVESTRKPQYLGIVISALATGSTMSLFAYDWFVKRLISFGATLKANSY